MLDYSRCLVHYGKTPYALESVHLSIITFDLEAGSFVTDPTHQVQLNNIDVPSAGATFMGAALELLAEQVSQKFKK